MDHTGEDGKEPVQTDQGELCKDMQRHLVSVSGHARNHMGRAQISVFYMEYFHWSDFGFIHALYFRIGNASSQF